MLTTGNELAIHVFTFFIHRTFNLNSLLYSFSQINIGWVLLTRSKNSIWRMVISKSQFCFFSILCFQNTSFYYNAMSAVMYMQKVYHTDRPSQSIYESIIQDRTGTEIRFQGQEATLHAGCEKSWFSLTILSEEELLFITSIRWVRNPSITTLGLVKV